MHDEDEMIGSCDSFVDAIYLIFVGWFDFDWEWIDQQTVYYQLRSLVHLGLALIDTLSDLKEIALQKTIFFLINISIEYFLNVGIP